MKRQGETLHVGVNPSTQIVRHPLANAGGQVFFAVGGDSIQNSDGHDRDAGKLYRGKLISSQELVDKLRQTGFSGMTLKDFVQYDLERPGLQEAGDCFAQNSNQTEGQRSGMRS